MRLFTTQQLRKRCSVPRITATTQFRNALSQTIIETTDDAVVSKLIDGRILSWNRGAERLFGYSAAEMLGKQITILVPAGRKKEERELITRLRAGERIEHFETQRRHKNGTLLEISVTFSPVYDTSGKVFAVSKIARDISTALRTREQQAIAASIIQHTEDAVISKSPNGIVCSWNRGAEKMFGYSAKEMIGRSIKGLFPRIGRPRKLTSRQGCVRTGPSSTLRPSVLPSPGNTSTSR